MLFPACLVRIIRFYVVDICWRIWHAGHSTVLQLNSEVPAGAESRIPSREHMVQSFLSPAGRGVHSIPNGGPEVLIDQRPSEAHGQQTSTSDCRYPRNQSLVRVCNSKAARSPAYVRRCASGRGEGLDQREAYAATGQRAHLAGLRILDGEGWRSAS